MKMYRPDQKPKHMKRPKYFKGGAVMKDGVPHFLNGGAATTGALGGAASGALAGSVIPGVGTLIGGAVGGILGGLGGLFSGPTNQMPNITDPVTGQQITDAQGNVVANQSVLQNYATNLQNTNGVANQQSALNSLQGVANGTVNPGLAQLNVTTGQNVANTEAEMASSRGANANVGLIDRQAAQQGSQIQGQAAGQAAAITAQNQVNAIGQEGQIAGQQVAETQAAQNAAATNALNNQGQLLGSQGTYNTNLTSGQASVNSGNTSIANTTQTNLLPLAQGAASGAGVSSVSNATPTGSNSLTMPALGSSSGFARGGQVAQGPHRSHVANYLFAKGGKVDAMVSAGERYLSPQDVKRVVENGENPLKLGTKFQGKAKVKGDSIKNDTIPAALQEGGVVLPRHIMNKKNKDHAELFVRRAVHMRNPQGKSK